MTNPNTSAINLRSTRRSFSQAWKLLHTLIERELKTVYKLISVVRSNGSYALLEIPGLYECTQVIYATNRAYNPVLERKSIDSIEQMPLLERYHVEEKACKLNGV